MPNPTQKSLQNAKGKYLQEGDVAKFGAEKGAACFSGRGALAKRTALKDVVEGDLKVVDAPAAAVERLAKAKAKADAAKAKEAARAAKAKPKKAKAAV